MQFCEKLNSIVEYAMLKVADQFSGVCSGAGGKVVF
jgi:hypothetical protein